MRIAAPLLLGLLLALGAEEPRLGCGCADSGLEIVDADGDGYGSTVDCDDSLAAVHPDAEEVCDGLDNDCDGETDEEATDARTWYADLDQDGYGDPESPQQACQAPHNYVADDQDCYDRSSDIHPGATEYCCDLEDDDCDGRTDEDCSGDLALLGQESWEDAGSVLALGGDMNADGLADMLVGAPGWDGDSGRLFLVHGAQGLAALETLPLYDSPAIVTGDDAYVGAALAFAGDMDQDGFEDLLVGAPLANSSAGEAGLFLGPLEGEFSLERADAALFGQGFPIRIGAAVAGVGDLNGDGHDDLAISAPHDYDDVTRRGSLCVLRGPLTGRSSWGELGTLYWGEAYDDLAGGALSAAGDVDGDGLADLLLGAPGHDPNGAAYLLLGPADTGGTLAEADCRIEGEQQADLLGQAVAGVGDVDGDGYDDVLLGAPGADCGATDGGAAWLLTGPLSNATLQDAAARLDGELALGGAGSALSAAGDLDGDGQLDLALGAPDSSHDCGEEVGAVYLVLGPFSGLHPLDQADHRLTSTVRGGAAGTAVAGGGDVDGDGYDDLLLGVPGQDIVGSDEGAAWLFFGREQP